MATSALASPVSPRPQFDFNAASCEQLFIGISGLIGAGKTTLATALGKELGLPVHYEPVIDNVYLEDFYKDMGRYSFQLQGAVPCPSPFCLLFSRENPYSRYTAPLLPSSFA